MKHFVKLMFFTLIASFALAQSTTSGDITGVVTDPSGAVVPHAKLTATNDGTGESHAATTNAEGSYRFSFLKPGSYTVKASAPGFQDNTRKVQVGLGQAATVNMAMAITSATTTVEVTTSALEVE